MKVKQILLLLSVVASFLSACGEKEICCVLPPQAEYTKGVFVVNEGPFGGSGTISWYNPQTGETQDSLFEKANNGARLGQFVQSLCFHEGKAYIVVNGSNRVVVVDAKTFEYIDTIGGLALPRFFLPVNSTTAYVSQWGLDGLTGTVAKINLVTNEVIKTIPTGMGPEKMILDNDRILVANSGGYGLDSTLSAISLLNDAVQTLPIQAGRNPACLALNTFQSPAPLLYLCKGYFNDPVPMGRLDYLLPGTPGVDVPAYSDDLVLDTDTGELYFIGGNHVYKFFGAGPDASLTLVFNQSVYGLGFDTALNLLYCADAKDFSSPGEVVIYRTDGTKIGSFRCGVAPGEIVIVK